MTTIDTSGFRLASKRFRSSDRGPNVSPASPAPRTSRRRGPNGSKGAGTVRQQLNAIAEGMTRTAGAGGPARSFSKRSSPSSRSSRRSASASPPLTTTLPERAPTYRDLTSLLNAILRRMTRAFESQPVTGQSVQYQDCRTVLMKSVAQGSGGSLDETQKSQVARRVCEERKEGVSSCEPFLGNHYLALGRLRDMSREQIQARMCSFEVVSFYYDSIMSVMVMDLEEAKAALDKEPKGQVVNPGFALHKKDPHWRNVSVEPTLTEAQERAIGITIGTRELYLDFTKTYNTSYGGETTQPEFERDAKVKEFFLIPMIRGTIRDILREEQRESAKSAEELVSFSKSRVTPVIFTDDRALLDYVRSSRRWSLIVSFVYDELKLRVQNWLRRRFHPTREYAYGSAQNNAFVLREISEKCSSGGRTRNNRYYREMCRAKDRCLEVVLKRLASSPRWADLKQRFMARCEFISRNLSNISDELYCTGPQTVESLGSRLMNILESRETARVPRRLMLMGAAAVFSNVAFDSVIDVAEHCLGDELRSLVSDLRSLARAAGKRRPESASRDRSFTTVLVLNHMAIFPGKKGDRSRIDPRQAAMYQFLSSLLFAFSDALQSFTYDQVGILGDASGLDLPGWLRG